MQSVTTFGTFLYEFSSFDFNSWAAAGKHTLMRAIERSTAVLPLHIVLRVLRLSH